jgi:hypothetical protein
MNSHTHRALRTCRPLLLLMAAAVAPSRPHDDRSPVLDAVALDRADAIERT